MPIRCYAAFEARQALKPHSYEPLPLDPMDVEIAITHCGICRSDVHLIDNDWGVSNYPLIPGHEIVGAVSALGKSVKDLRVGQRVGVGWQSGSCMACEWCAKGEETCCPQQTATCIGHPGGYAGAIHVDSRFAFPLPRNISSEHAAPLMCAGATVYGPLSELSRPASRVGIIGVGGLGHLALQFAHAFGCEVTAFSTVRTKERDARRFGADHFVLSRSPGQMKKVAHSFDLLLSVATGKMDWPAWIDLLRPRGTLWILGLVPGTLDIAPMSLMVGHKTVRGSSVANRSVIQEMLQFAARHGIRPRTAAMPMAEVNAALNKVRHNRARYRIVLAN